nr:hypothetical protein [uncultured Caproiciproducens sp.]
MKKRIEPLTPSERDFAEKNHNLIYAYLIHKKLPKEDWYDIAAYGYILAVKEWHRHPEYSFGSVAFYYMNGQVSHEYDGRNRQKRSASIISINSPTTDDMSLIEKLSNDENIEDTVEIKCIAGLIQDHVNPKYSKTVELLKAGYSQTEISRILGVTTQTVSKRKFAIRESCKKYAI